MRKSQTVRMEYQWRFKNKKLIKEVVFIQSVLLPTPWLFNTNAPNCISLLPIFKRNHNNHKFQIVGPYILTFVSKSWPHLRQHLAENSLIYKSKCFVYRYFGEDSYLSDSVQTLEVNQLMTTLLSSLRLLAIFASLWI